MVGEHGVARIIAWAVIKNIQLLYRYLVTLMLTLDILVLYFPIILYQCANILWAPPPKKIHGLSSTNPKIILWSNTIVTSNPKSEDLGQH
jgi:hypothetical protein